MAELKKYYWDANVWLGLVNEEDAKLNNIKYHYELAKRGESELWTSTLAYVEVFYLTSEQALARPLPQEGLDIIQDAIEQDFVKLVTVDMEIGRKARLLRRQIQDLKGAADSVHLASALTWCVDALFTYDRPHLLAQNGKIPDKKGRPLRICEPDGPPPLPLFATGGGSSG